MSTLLSAELVAICNSLGYFDVEENKYYADQDTLESVKDLIRYLKRDDEMHDIRMHLGATKVVQTDLLPILKTYWEQTDLFDVTLRLLVNLTTPALMLWNEEIPTERKARNRYLQIEEHLRWTKQGFTDEQVWAVLSSRISKILEVDTAERPEENGLIIERILILIRNILHVPADPDAEKRTDNDANVHDQVLWALHQSGMLDIILYISAGNEKSYYMHVLEIMSYMLRDQNAKELATAVLQRSQTEKMRDEAELLAIRHKEANKKQQRVRNFQGTRHSRFGGTYVVKSMKSLSDNNELIYHKPLNKFGDINLDADKAQVRTPKNRAPMMSSQVERRSAFSIRLFLKEFCVEFLNGAYNTFMYIAKERLSRQQAQKHDETYYLWAIRFFLEFNRCYKFDIKLVSETVSVQTFQYVQRQLENYSDMMSSDKKYVRLWGKRLHVALLTYRELLYTLCAMDKSNDEAVRTSSKVIKSNIFYVLEYREQVLQLLINFNTVTMTPEYLKDVLETQHVFLKLFEGYCSGKSIMVAEKAKRKKKIHKSNGAKSGKAKKDVYVDIEALWRCISDVMVEYLDGSTAVREEMQWKVSEIIKDRMPDASQATSASFTYLGVQKLAMAEEYEEVVALMLETRDLYPNLIQRFDDTPSQLEEFKNIFFTTAEPGLTTEREEPEEPIEPEDNYQDEEDELEDQYETHESDLKFEDFIKRLAHPKVVHACALALKNFDSNTPLTNHCIVKLLHRIAFDLKMSAIIFQVSIFQVFQEIFQGKALPQNKELVKFATYIIRQFFVVAAKNRNVYMESLFWKTVRDAVDVEEGYNSYQEKSKAAMQAWSEHEEDELRRLFEEHQENSIDRDVVDWIVDNLVDNTKTRRAVLKKLKQMYLLVDYKAQKKSVGKPVPKEWSGEEVEQLQELFEQFKEAMDPLTCIMERLNVRRPKRRIIEKLLELGLVQDKKELRKKRVKKSKSGVSGPFQDVGEDIDSDDESSSNDDNSESDEENNESIHKSHSQNSSQAIHNKTQKSTKKKSNPSKKSSTKEIAKMLIDLAGGEIKEGLDWLKESFEDVKEDWNENEADGEGIPLVPILDYSIAAMENQDFLALLRGMNIHEPSEDGQEAYWRIPTTLSLLELQNYIDLLTKALAGNLIQEEEPTEGTDDPSEENTVSQAMENQDPESEEEYVFENLNKSKADKNQKMRELIKKIARTKTNDSELRIAGIDDENEIEENIYVSQKSEHKKKRIQIESSDDETEDPMPDLQGEDESDKMSFMPTKIRDFDEVEESTNNSESEEPQVMFKSARIIIDSDEDEEKETSNSGYEIKHSKGRMNLLDNEEKDNSDKENSVSNQDSDSKRLRSTSDSENEKPKLKRPRVIISDDED